MSGIARKIERNKLKDALKKNKQKRTQPLSKYRFKTEEEKRAELAEQLTDHMLQTAKEAEHKKVNND